MADNNPGMPSEDEDFDAVHSGEPVMSDFDDNSSEGSDSKTTTVQVMGDEPSEAPSEPQASETPEQQPETTDSFSAEPAEAAPVEEPQPEEAPAAPVDEPAEVDNVEAETVADAEASDPAGGDEVVTDSTPVEAAVDAAPAVITEAPKAPKIKQPGSGSAGRTIFEIVLVVVLVAVGYFAWQLNSDKKDLQKQLAAANSNPQTIIQKQTDALIAKVGQLMQLPKGETPTVANVTDAAQAKKQSAFFNNAQNGDKVLMYVKSGQAILYRPSTNKIILVAPLTFTGTSAKTK